MDISAMKFMYQTDVVTKKQFDDHITLYNGYVEKTNETTHKLQSQPELAGANATYSHYRAIKKGESYAIDGVILHELYFQNLIRENANIGKKTKYLMDHYFGGVDQWREEFIACAKAARGWSLFCFEQRTDSCRNILLDKHDEGLICSAYPLLALDVYEHAYFLDYGPDKAAYINRFMAQIPWNVIEKRVSAVMR